MTETLTDYAKQRIEATAKIAVCLVCDGVLSLLWLLFAWLVNSLQQVLANHGITDSFVTAFVWISEGGTLILAALYIISDIHAAYKQILAR